jgi:hypothetical protein
MENKYVFANIKIPIEVKENNEIEPLREHIQITFERCIELPPKQEINSKGDYFMETLRTILNQEKSETTEEAKKEEKEEKKLEEIIPEIMVLKSEIKNDVKRIHNTSFKTKPKPMNRFSVKNRG